jgi:hypothetical protein
MPTAGTTRSRERLRRSISHALARCLVHQVDGHHHAARDFQHLQHQIQIPLDRRGVDDDDGDIGPAEEQEVARNLFIARGGQQ